MAYKRSLLEIVASRRLLGHFTLRVCVCNTDTSGVKTPAAEKKARDVRRDEPQPSRQPVVCIPHQGHHLPQIHVFMNSMTLADNKYAGNATCSQCCTGFQEDSLLPALGLLLPNPATQSADDGRSTSHFPD